MKRRSQTLAADSDVASVALGENMSEPAVSEESARSERVVEVVARAPPRSTPTVMLMRSHADRQRSPNQGDSQPSVQKG
uniref:hypothetical protein n=1 Tax=Streptomyces albovinaceus TaxID=66867 RepID=UPI001ABF459B